LGLPGRSNTGAYSPARARVPHLPDPHPRRHPRRRLRKTNARFVGDAFQQNLRIVDERQNIATEAGATSAQIALAWLLAQGTDIAAIPGTRRVARVEENTAADSVDLTAHQLQRLNTLTPATGDRHDEANMASIDR